MSEFSAFGSLLMDTQLTETACITLEQQSSGDPQPEEGESASKVQKSGHLPGFPPESRSQGSRRSVPRRTVRYSLERGKTGDQGIFGHGQGMCPGQRCQRTGS